MTYQALARKFRPKKFSDVIGQPIIVQALRHALKTHKIHHAYLLTGTRGVGKTTVGRLIAKALNCKKPIEGEPCLDCENCLAIDHQYSPDLIEVDGASKTKVEEIRALLENVQYLPNQGKYRIYLIDEVHMLSMHSFNALLKTLEEPPAHVIFILATTEPHKIPVTIASRCLQLAFRAISEHELCCQLESVLTQENIVFEHAALIRLARAGSGSLRDSLSLLEQAIGAGLGTVTEQAVSQMLGLSSKINQLDILQSVLDQKPDVLFSQIRELSAQAIDFRQLLNSLMELLHEIALQQVLKSTARADSDLIAQRILNFSEIISPQQIQVFYQIVLEGQKNLSYMPSPQSGFEMICLRLLMFQKLELPIPDLNGSELLSDEIPETGVKNISENIPDNLSEKSPVIQNNQPNNQPNNKSVLTLNWLDILPDLKLTGLAQVIAKQCVFGSGSIEQGKITLILNAAHRLLLNPAQIQKIQMALSEYAGHDITVSIDISETESIVPPVQKQPSEFQTESQIQSKPKIHAVLKHPTGQAIVETLQAKLVRVSPITD